jgi:hypothetical protein
MTVVAMPGEVFVLQYVGPGLRLRGPVAETSRTTRHAKMTLAIRLW